MAKFNKITLHFIDEETMTLKNVDYIGVDQQTVRVDLDSGESYLFNANRIQYTLREYVAPWHREG